MRVRMLSQAAGWAARSSALLAGALILHSAVARLAGLADPLIWLLDMRPLGPVGPAAAWLAGALLLAAAVQPAMSRWRRHATLAATAGLTAVAVVNSCSYWLELLAGRVSGGPALPLSLFIAVAMGGAAWWVWRGQAGRGGAVSLAKAAAGAAMLACMLAVGQMVTFGRTDYRQPADAIVVLGAGVRADGTCSDALTDRVATACELYHRGYAPVIVMSGGPGMGDVHETEGMRRLAESLGVPREAILLDRAGLNTRATAVNTASLLGRRDGVRVLAVSHAYHLPRVKLACQRAGVDVRTVPARESYLLTAMPYYMARETAALWAYMLRWRS